mgnify:CR=1 FL=1
MTTENFSVVIAGGGTAGHIEPALAVAEVLRDSHGADVTALGTEKGLEAQGIERDHGDDRANADQPGMPRMHRTCLGKGPGEVNRPAPSPPRPEASAPRSVPVCGTMWRERHSATDCAGGR